MKKNKLVMCVQSFPKLSETFIVNKFVGLVAKGWDVHIVCANYSREDLHNFPVLEASKELRNRIHVSWSTSSRILAAVYYPSALLAALFNNPIGAIIYWMRGFNKYRMGIIKKFYLDAKIIEQNANIIHFEFGTLAAEHAAISYLPATKIVTSFRGFDINFVGIENDEYYEEVWRSTEIFHFLGSSLRNRALERGLPDHKPYKMIPAAVDIDKFHLSEKGTEKEAKEALSLRIVSVGRLEWKKGYEYALMALWQLMERNVQFDYRIIGAGSYLECLCHTRYQLGLEGCVEFLGAQNQDVIKENLRWANVFLHSAVSEGFCNAVLEAQAMQLPVVCADAGGLSENVHDGVSGFVVQKYDANALCEKLHVLAADPSLRRQMGKAGRKRVELRFNLKDQIQAFDDLYECTLKNNRDLALI